MAMGGDMLGGLVSMLGSIGLGCGKFIGNLFAGIFTGADEAASKHLEGKKDGDEECDEEGFGNGMDGLAYAGNAGLNQPVSLNIGSAGCFPGGYPMSPTGSMFGPGMGY